MLIDFSNMTTKEIRKKRNKLAIELQSKEHTSDYQNNWYKERRTRQISQAKMELYVILNMISMFVGTYLGAHGWKVNVKLFIIIQALIPLAMFILYFIAPNLERRILTYRIRYWIPALLYFIAQTDLMIYVGVHGGEDFSKYTLLFVGFYVLIGLPIVTVQNYLEQKVYAEREKDIFQKFSWNDWYSEKIFKYEHMSPNEINAEFEDITKIKEQIGVCNQELRARRLERKNEMD